MAKITNGQNVENFEKREKLLIGWFACVSATIVLAVISLILNYGLKNETAGNICMLVSVCTFFISIIFRRMRDKLVVEKKDTGKNKKSSKTGRQKTKTNKKGKK